MKRLLVFVCALGLCVAGLGVPSARAASDTTAVEARFLEIMNDGRAASGLGAEVMHAGLREKARAHSAYQASINGLTHDGFSSRIFTATPDPAESNGAPDDGFGSACENVAYFGPASSYSTEQAAQMFYEMWFESRGHHDCMFDSLSGGSRGFNVAGMGVYQDSRGYWWATFESVNDLTAPAAGPPGPTWMRVEQDAPNVQSTGLGWKTKKSKQASGSSYRQSLTTNDASSFTFDGPAVRLIASKAPSGAIAEVRIDGISVGTVDTYAAEKTYQKVIFEQTDLGPGSHTMQVVVTGTKNALAKKKSYVVVDAFQYLTED